MQWQVKSESQAVEATSNKSGPRRRWRLPRVQLSIRHSPQEQRQEQKQNHDRLTTLRSRLAMPASRSSSGAYLLRAGHKQQRSRSPIARTKAKAKATSKSKIKQAAQKAAVVARGCCGRSSSSLLSFFRASPPCRRGGAAQYSTLQGQQAWNQDQLKTFLNPSSKSDKWRNVSLSLQLNQDIWIEIEPLPAKTKPSEGQSTLTHKMSSEQLVKEETRYSPLL